jgi:hypothetical protein
MRPDFVLLQDATREQLLEFDLAICSFSRLEVEAARVGGAVDRLMELSDDDAVARHLEGRLALVFDGYDDDPRELYEIPEVVQFFRAVTAAWPMWFHFLERRGPSLGVAVRLLVDARVAERGSDCRADVDRDVLQAALMRMFEGMNALHARLRLPSTHTCRSTDLIVRAVFPD